MLRWRWRRQDVRNHWCCLPFLFLEPLSHWCSCFEEKTVTHGRTNVLGRAEPLTPPLCTFSPHSSPDCFIVFECHCRKPPAGGMQHACSTATAATLRTEFVLAAFAFWIPSSAIKFTKILQQQLNHWAEACSRVNIIRATAEPSGSHDCRGFPGICFTANWCIKCTWKCWQTKLSGCLILFCRAPQKKC